MYMKVIAPLALCALVAAAHAQEPAEPVTRALILLPSAQAQAREEADARALDARRRQMIDECEDNHGSQEDCEREVDTELRAEGLQGRRRVIRAPGS